VEIIAILKRCTVGRLATIGMDGYPYITPVNYVYWQDSVYFHCSHKGEKIDNLKRNPKVCFEVDIPLAYKGTDCDPQAAPCHSHQFYHSVILRGRAEIVSDTTEKVPVLNALMASHENIPDFSCVTREMPGVAACTVVGISIESISAKSDLAQNKSAEDKKMIAEYLRKRNRPGDAEAAKLIVS
jgi:nitroimidazol reductase NimA-like FMN-containing flavoprotein (pyridoxamine 5'-phosphate oxidase superfamily)